MSLLVVVIILCMTLPTHTYVILTTFVLIKMILQYRKWDKWCFWFEMIDFIAHYELPCK